MLQLTEPLGRVAIEELLEVPLEVPLEVSLKVPLEVSVTFCAPLLTCVCIQSTYMVD